jgi:hypothetical protein
MDAKRMSHPATSAYAVSVLALALILSVVVVVRNVEGAAP